MSSTLITLISYHILTRIIPLNTIDQLDLSKVLSSTCNPPPLLLLIPLTFSTRCLNLITVFVFICLPRHTSTVLNRLKLHTTYHEAIQINYINWYWHFWNDKLRTAVTLNPFHSVVFVSRDWLSVVSRRSLFLSTKKDAAMKGFCRRRAYTRPVSLCYNHVF